MPDEWRERTELGISEWYDPEGDTYYVTLKTGEPSYCLETNDVLLVEIGLFSGLPTGYRVLNYSKKGSGKLALEALSQFATEVNQALADRANERKAELDQAIRKVLVPA
jgi:hypothetical protein